MEEMLIIPRKEAEQDVDFYKGELTGNVWLERARQLAAAKKRILNDPRLCRRSRSKNETLEP